MALSLGVSGYSLGSSFFGSGRRIYNSELLTRICFGSCNNQNLPQEFWKNIEKTNPNLWVWLGDNIYADYASPEQRRDEYISLQKNRFYERFAGNIPMVATWDDHDFAYDNSDGSYQEKESSQDAFCDFLRLSQQHVLRHSQGVYQSFVYGSRDNRRVHLILLDLRYFKAEDQLLGEAQWQWLTRELMSSPGDLILIGSSLAVLSEYTGFGLEGWAAYKTERKRLFDLLDICQQPVLLISGDRHYTELSCKSLRSGKMLYEFMASGLTHNTPVGLPNTYRIVGRAGENNFGQIDIQWHDERVLVSFRALSANRDRELYSYGDYLDLSV